MTGILQAHHKFTNSFRNITDVITRGLCELKYSVECVTWIMIVATARFQQLVKHQTPTKPWGHWLSLAPVSSHDPLEDEQLG